MTGAIQRGGGALSIWARRRLGLSLLLLVAMAPAPRAEGEAPPDPPPVTKQDLAPKQEPAPKQDPAPKQEPAPAETQPADAAQRYDAAAAAEETAPDAAFVDAGTTAKPGDVSSNGSFQRDFPLDVPAFRGLEPRLGLRYESSSGARAGTYWAGLAGVGFRVAGLSDIVRGSVGGGSPRFDGTDTYHLDGEPLVACTAATTSPACTTQARAGFRYFATRRESYLRVALDASATGEWHWRHHLED